MNRNKLATRFNIINIFLIVIIMTITFLICGRMIYNLIDNVAKDYVRFYTTDSVDRLSTHLYREISLVQHIAHSDEVIEWFADEENLDKKAEAFQVLSVFGDVLLIDGVYFGILSSLNEYSFDSGTAFEDVAPIDVLDPESIYDQWFFDAVFSIFDYTLNLDECKVTGTKRIWINHKVIYNGNTVGIICSALQFDYMFENLFGYYDDHHVRGFVIDHRGIIQLDSANPERAFATSEDPSARDEIHILSIDSNEDFIRAINLHLRNPQIFHGLRIEPEIIRLSGAEYQYLSIAPIPNTNWLVVTFYSSAALFNITNMLPPIMGVALAFLFFAFINIAFIQLLVLKPLNLLTRSVSQSVHDVNNVYGIKRDDEIGALSRAMSETYTQLEAANRSKSEFLANMSHEIRTPMNAIIGATEIMMQNKLPTEVEEGLLTIYNSCDLLLGIINDILDFSKIEAGKLDISLKQYEIASLINDSVHLNMMLINSKPIEFEVLVDENLPAKLVGDELRIKQILNNLLSNSFKYTDSGTVTLSISYEKPEGDNIILLLRVQDTGHGMTNEQQVKLFSEYTRFYNEKNTTVIGTGLGLTITQRLVNLMDGEIIVESELERGSTFTVRLPQKTVDTEILGFEMAENLRRFRMSYIKLNMKNRITRTPMPYGKVLIVDDVETNLYVASGLMNLYKLQIDMVVGGRGAIKRVEDGMVYDIIFMDHMMPEMDGMEVTKYLRDTGYNAPIVALTANAVAGQADIFISNGFDDFISKPIDTRQLDIILNKYIRDKQPPEVLEAAKQQEESRIAELYTEEHEDVSPRLIESFVRDARKTITEIEEIYYNSDLENEATIRLFTILTHGIKSALINIGKPKLSELASILETGLREKNVSIIKKSTPDFLYDLCRLVEELEESNLSGDMAGSEVNAENMREELTAVNKMCSEFNRKEALDILDGMNDYSNDTGMVLEKIKEQVLSCEYKKAGDIISAYLTILNVPVDDLDTAKGLKRYEFDADTYMNILKSYTKSIHPMLGSIENVSRESLAEYKILVHGIKGASFGIHAEKIAEKAEALEKASKDGDFEYVIKNNPEFVEDLSKLLNNIDALFSTGNDEILKPVKDKPDDELLSKLLEACESFDIDEADAVLSEIEKYNYESDAGLSSWLRENIETMNYSAIIKKLT